MHGNRGQNTDFSNISNICVLTPIFAKMITAVRRIVFGVIEQALRHLSGCAPIKARFGAISYLHRFGFSLNPHVHFHCCVTDGLFSAEADGVKFHI
jgi:hypothetical protein